MGWSQAGGGTRDARSAAAALGAALDVAGIEPPYVVDGHSYGALGHVSMLTDRDQAAQVADEIRRFVSEATD